MSETELTPLFLREGNNMEERAGLRIRLYGDPILRKKAKAVGTVTQAHQGILSEMARLMYEHDGMGLAAPQVGIDEALIVVDIGKGLYKLINPEIVNKGGRQVNQEGCLSLPGVCIKVKRAKKIKVLAEDAFGKPISIETEDLFACVLQHEIEHLKGKLIVDYANLFEKLKIRKKIKQLQKKAEDEPRPSYKGWGAKKEEERGEELSETKRKSCKLQL